MKIRKAVIAALSAGHGLNDMLAGYLLVHCAAAGNGAGRYGITAV